MPHGCLKVFKTSGALLLLLDSAGLKPRQLTANKQNSKVERRPLHSLGSYSWPMPRKQLGFKTCADSGQAGHC
eukprot:scaffold259335_cov13-Tisochrysis_lutea.AAC.1